jgi:hypothetical protein
MLPTSRYSYHRFFAWVPTRMRSGQLVWLRHYYMRPDSNGWGLCLSQRERQLESLSQQR